MDEHQSYVQADQHGVMRVAGTHVMLDSVLAAFEQGHAPETIRAQYPSLTLEQVYGAIAYYLSHRPEVEQYPRRQDAEWGMWKARAEQQAAPVVQRLRALQNAKAGQTP